MKYLSKKHLLNSLAFTSAFAMALPAVAQFDGAAPTKQEHAEFLSEAGFAMENCDVIATPGDLKGTLDAVTTKLSPASIVCLTPGELNADLHLKAAGLRLVALRPGSVKIAGSVYASSPVVLFGLNIDVLALDASSAGSVVAACQLGKSASMTSDVILLGNSSANGAISGPMGDMSLSYNVPSSAKAIVLGNNMNSVIKNSDGNLSAAGWLPRSSLTSVETGESASQGKSLTKIPTGKGKAVVKTLGNIATASTWFDQNSLVSHTVPSQEGETLKRGQETPVYRDPATAAKPLSTLVFVPLHTGVRPDLQRLGVIFGVIQ
ncbi:MAG: hypothetical protein VYC39_05235 [Myxococcota bacterium]|nr:hypothetical protein [Myxococcota bacterium]